MRYERAEPGNTVATLRIGAEHCNPHGICHGGAIFTLVDDSMGAAAYPLCPDGHLPTSTQVNIHYARSTRPGATLRAETTVASHGRRTAVLESRVTDEHGRLVALVTAAYLFVEDRSTDPEA